MVSRGSRPWVALAAAGVCLAVARPGECQSRSGGWAVDRFDPSAAGDRFFAAQYPTYQDLGVRFGVVGDYAYHPLVVRQGADASPVIEHMLVLHAQVGVSLLQRIGIDISMPFTLLESGPAQGGGVNGVAASNGFALGDPRLGARVRVFGNAAVDPVSLHVGGQLYFGLIYNDADRSNNSTDAALRGRVWLNAAGTISKVFHWSLEAGYHGRPTVQNLGTEVNADLYVRLALGLDVTDEFTVAPEFYASNVLDAQYGVNAEAVLGLHYRVADTVSIGLAGGPGLTHGAGTPTFRGLFSLAYAPEERAHAATPPAAPADTDGDGVLDPQDQCLTVPQGPHPDPARTGCPLADRDGDGVLDPEDQCVDTPAGNTPDPARAGCPDGDDDNDGVRNAEDQCRTEHQSEHPDPHRPGCPDHDGDGDRVYDAADQCPEVPAGIHPDADPARAGCPAPDRDGDTVIDPSDHCPDQPGIPTSNPETNGCPSRQLVVEHGVLRLLSPVYFATNSDRILSRSFPVLTAVAQVFHDAPEITHVVIEGHTDDVGNDAANLELSQRRANSVLQWLTQNGIEAGRLEAHGFGETRPVTPIAGLHGHALRDARSANRRVEFRIQPTADAQSNANANANPAPAATP